MLCRRPARAAVDPIALADRVSTRPRRELIFLLRAAGGAAASDHLVAAGERHCALPYHQPAARRLQRAGGDRVRETLSEGTSGDAEERNKKKGVGRSPQLSAA